MKQLAGFVKRQCTARPLAMFASAYLAGIVCCDKTDLPIVVWLLALVGTGILYFLFRSGRAGVCLLLAAFALGAIRLDTALSANPQIPELFSVRYSGTVVSEPTLNKAGDRIVCAFRLNELDGRENRSTLRLYLRSDTLPLEGIEYGQRLEVFGHVWPQSPVSNPGQFDSVRWLLSDGMTGMAAAKLEDVSVSPGRPSLARGIIAVRGSLEGQIRRLFPRNADLVCALILGDRSGIGTAVEESFRESGITHLICISGMHISVLAAAVSGILSRVLSRKSAILTTLAAILLYGALIGFPASLIRATIMYAIFSLAPLFGLPSDSVTRLGAALLGMLLFHPFSIYDGGFVLSFGASAGIILIEPPLESLIGIDSLRGRRVHARPLRRLLRKLTCYFPQLLCVTFAAQLATLPAILAYFDGQSVLSLPVNLLSIPMVMAAYPVALAALVSSVWLPLGQCIAAVADGILSLLVALTQSVSALGLPALRIPEYPFFLLILHMGVCVAASGLTKIRLGIRKLLPLAATLLIPLSMLCAWLNCYAFRAVFLDAGQADAAVIHSKGHTIMIDAGDEYSPAADYISSHCLSLDAVFLSHPHYDHAAGLTELLEVEPPDVIYVPKGWFQVEADDSVTAAVALAREMDIPVIELSAGDSLTLPGGLTALVHGPDSIPAEVNDLSMLVEIRREDRSLFFTGDVSSAEIPSDLPDVDVLKVPHHGSGNSSDPLSLKSLAPEVAVISVGENNYGHPSSKTLEALSSAGASVYRTDECGAITVLLHADGTLEVKTYLSREESP